MKAKIITLSIVAVAAITSVGIRSQSYDIRSAKKLAGGGRNVSYEIRSAKKLAGGGRNVSFDIRSAKKAFVA
jgi:hypothetical protein